MRFWENVTGSDLTREWKAFEARAGELPVGYQEAWTHIKAGILPKSDLTGRNLMPIFDGVLGLLEESAADGLDVRDVLGDDVEGFCVALTGGEGARTYRDRWREQLNRDIAKKLSRLGD